MAEKSSPAADLIVYDYDKSVPAEVISRWNRLEPDRAVLTDLAFLFATVGSIIVGLSAVAGVFAGVPALAAVVTLIVCAAALVLLRGRRTRLVRRGRLLSPSEMDQLITHRVQVCFPPTESAGEEAELAARAQLITADLIASTAWHSTALDSHSEQLDPVEEARQIHLAAWRLRQFRAQLGERPTGDDGLAEHTETEWTHLDAQADATLATLRRRVDVLERYGADLLAMSELLDRKQRLTELQALAEQQTALLALDQASHELAVDRVTHLDLQASTRTVELRNDGAPARLPARPDPDADAT